MIVYSIVLFESNECDRRKRDDPEVFLATTATGVVAQVKRFMRDAYEYGVYEEDHDPIELEKFKGAETFEQLKEWFNSYYCSFDVTELVEELK